ncbi:MAG: ATP-binding protein [Actinobacteria bacterium]|nr:ATP-binding protein [Actinomycetota bacterium]
MNEAVIALIGAGNGGLALLKVLLEIPGVKIKYVCDTNPDAVGCLFAKEHQIFCITDYSQIIKDKDVSLIFEATGNPEVFVDLSKKKFPRISLIGAEGARIVYNLLDAYNEINQNLNEYKNNLEKKIIERTEELEKANEKLGKEMMEYEKLNQKLQEMSNEKTKYLLYATHQLKAPFAAIQSYVDIILDGYAGEIPQRTRDIILKIKQRCELLSNVIKEMLELAKLKAFDAADTNLKKLDINQILSAVVQRYQVIASTKEIQIDLIYDDFYLKHYDGPFSPLNEAFYIKGYEKQIDVLFSTLIENAINYSPPNSVIKIIIKKMGSSQLYIGIQDQGIGIPEKNLSKIFSEFFRSNNAVEFHHNGTGLGLSIAKEIAAIHNTSIQVESVLNQGSCFSMIFQLIE